MGKGRPRRGNGQLASLGGDGAPHGLLSHFVQSLKRGGEAASGAESSARVDSVQDETEGLRRNFDPEFLLRDAN